MRISDCWISICLNPNHLYVDCCLFHGFQLPDFRIIRNNPTPRKPAFEWVRCGDQGGWQSLPKNKMSCPAWHDSRSEGFFLIPSVIFGVGSSKRPHRQGKNNKLCFVYLVHGKFFLFCWASTRVGDSHPRNHCIRPLQRQTSFRGMHHMRNLPCPWSNFQANHLQGPQENDRPACKEQTTTNQSLACCDCTKFER